MADRFVTVDSITRLFPKATMDALRIALGGLGSVAYTADLPAGAAGKVTVEHNLGTRLVHVIVYDTAVEPWLNVKVPYTSPAGGKTVILDFGVARAAGQYKVAVVPLTPSSTPTNPTTPPSSSGVAPSIKTDQLNPMTQGADFEQQLIIDGTAEISVSVVSGSIAGVSVSSAGKVSGKPTNAGNYSIRVRAVNAYGSVEKTLTGTVSAPPVASSWSSYTTDSFSGPDAADINGRTTDLADGGVSKQWVSSGYGITAGALVAVGAVPGWAFVPLASTACEISGVVKTMPNATAEAHLFAMELSRSAVAASGVSCYRVRMYATGNLAITRVLNGTETSDPLAISEASSFKAGDVITLRRIDSADRTAAYISVRVNDAEVADFVDRSPLPAGSYAGFYRDGRTGAFDTVAIRTQSTTISLPSITTATLPSMTVGSPVSATIAATGDPTIVFSAVSGLPEGLTLSQGGALSGIPKTSGAYTLVVRATNSGGFVEKTFTGSITAAGSTGGGAPGGIVFGAEGRYWPTATPQMSEITTVFQASAATWAAIASAISTVLSTTPVGAKVAVDVPPGVLASVYKGAGSTEVGLLQSLGSAERTHNIVVRPRDGFGTVTVQQQDAAGCAFVNMQGVTLMGIDFTDVGLMIRNSTRFHISHTFAKTLNMSANGGSGLNSCEYVEVVCGPAISPDDVDRSSIRTANGIAATDNGFLGVYFGPKYKIQGMTGHCDTMQFSASGSSPNIGTRVWGCVLWQSSNQGWIATETPHCQRPDFRDTLFIGGISMMSKRYPQDSNMYQTTSDKVFAGGALDISMRGCIVIGDISNAHTFASVVNTKVKEAEAATVASGSFTVDSTLGSTSQAQLDAWTPPPSVSRQRALWGAQFAK